MSNEIDDEKLRDRVHALRVRIETAREQIRIDGDKNNDRDDERTKRRILHELRSEVERLRKEKATLLREIEEFEAI